ncbi:MAG: hypothetical protein C4346_12135 [Chloroflexota bacterium]
MLGTTGRWLHALESHHDTVIPSDSEGSRVVIAIGRHATDGHQALVRGNSASAREMPQQDGTALGMTGTREIPRLRLGMTVRRHGMMRDFASV